MERKIFENLVNDSDDNLLEKEILNDKEIMKELALLGVKPSEVTRYLPILIRHKESKDACKGCCNLNDCKSESIHLKTNLILSDAGGLTVQMGPCPLQAKYDVIASNYIYSDFPEDWIYRANASESKRATAIMGELKGAYKSESKRWCYFYGKQGTGKSFLTVAFTNAVAAKGQKVAFINANTMFDQIKSLMIKNRPAAEKIMSELASVKVLVIDDFGSEFKSDYVRDQIVMPLLNSRSKGKGMTIICSNYTIDDIETLYSFNKPAAILAKQLVETIKRNISGQTDVPASIETMF